MLKRLGSSVISALLSVLLATEPLIASGPLTSRLSHVNLSHDVFDVQAIPPLRGFYPRVRTLGGALTSWIFRFVSSTAPKAAPAPHSEFRGKVMKHLQTLNSSKKWPVAYKFYADLFQDPRAPELLRTNAINSYVGGYGGDRPAYIVYISAVLVLSSLAQEERPDPELVQELTELIGRISREDRHGTRFFKGLQLSDVISSALSPEVENTSELLELTEAIAFLGEQAYAVASHHLAILSMHPITDQRSQGQEKVDLQKVEFLLDFGLAGLESQSVRSKDVPPMQNAIAMAMIYYARFPTIQNMLARHTSDVSQWVKDVYHRDLSASFPLLGTSQPMGTNQMRMYGARPFSEVWVDPWDVQNQHWLKEQKVRGLIQISTYWTQRYFSVGVGGNKTRFSLEEVLAWIDQARPSETSRSRFPFFRPKPVTPLQQLSRTIWPSLANRLSGPATSEPFRSAVTELQAMLSVSAREILSDIFQEGKSWVAPLRDHPFGVLVASALLILDESAQGRHLEPAMMSQLENLLKAYNRSPFMKDTGHLSVPVLFSYALSGYSYHAQVADVLRLVQQLKFLPRQRAEALSFQILQQGMHEDDQLFDLILAENLLEDGLAMWGEESTTNRWRLERAMVRLLYWYVSPAIRRLIKRFGVPEIRRWVLDSQEADASDPAPLTAFDFYLGITPIGVDVGAPIDEILLAQKGAYEDRLRPMARMKLIQALKLRRPNEQGEVYGDTAKRQGHYDGLLARLTEIERGNPGDGGHSGMSGSIAPRRLTPAGQTRRSQIFQLGINRESWVGKGLQYFSAAVAALKEPFMLRRAKSLQEALEHFEWAHRRSFVRVEGGWEWRPLSGSETDWLLAHARRWFEMFFLNGMFYWTPSRYILSVVRHFADNVKTIRYGGPGRVIGLASDKARHLHLVSDSSEFSQVTPPQWLPQKDAYGREIYIRFAKEFSSQAESYRADTRILQNAARALIETLAKSTKPSRHYGDYLGFNAIKRGGRRLYYSTHVMQISSNQEPVHVITLLGYTFDKSAVMMRQGNSETEDWVAISSIARREQNLLQDPARAEELSSFLFPEEHTQEESFGSVLVTNSSLLDHSGAPIFAALAVTNVTVLASTWEALQESLLEMRSGKQAYEFTLRDLIEVLRPFMLEGREPAQAAKHAIETLHGNGRPRGRKEVERAFESWFRNWRNTELSVASAVARAFQASSEPAWEALGVLHDSFPSPLVALAVETQFVSYWQAYMRALRQGDPDQAADRDALAEILEMGQEEILRTSRLAFGDQAPAKVMELMSEIETWRHQPPESILIRPHVLPVKAIERQTPRKGMNSAVSPKPVVKVLDGPPDFWGVDPITPPEEVRLAFEEIFARYNNDIGVESFLRQHREEDWLARMYAVVSGLAPGYQGRTKQTAWFRRVLPTHQRVQIQAELSIALQRPLKTLNSTSHFFQQFRDLMNTIQADEREEGSADRSMANSIADHLRETLPKLPPEAILTLIALDARALVPILKRFPKELLEPGRISTIHIVAADMDQAEQMVELGTQNWHATNSDSSFAIKFIFHESEPILLDPEVVKEIFHTVSNSYTPESAYLRLAHLLNDVIDRPRVQVLPEYMDVIHDRQASDLVISANSLPMVHSGLGTIIDRLVAERFGLPEDRWPAGPWGKGDEGFSKEMGRSKIYRSVLEEFLNIVTLNHLYWMAQEVKPTGLGFLIGRTGLMHGRSHRTQDSPLLQSREHFEGEQDTTDRRWVDGFAFTERSLDRVLAMAKRVGGRGSKVLYWVSEEKRSRLGWLVTEAIFPVETFTDRDHALQVGKVSVDDVKAAIASSIRDDTAHRVWNGSTTASRTREDEIRSRREHHLIRAAQKLLPDELRVVLDTVDIIVIAGRFLLFKDRENFQVARAGVKRRTIYVSNDFWNAIRLRPVRLAAFLAHELLHILNPRASESDAVEQERRVDPNHTLRAAIDKLLPLSRIGRALRHVRQWQDRFLAIFSSESSRVEHISETVWPTLAQSLLKREKGTDFRPMFDALEDELTEPAKMILWGVFSSGADEGPQERFMNHPFGLLAASAMTILDESAQGRRTNRETFARLEGLIDLYNKSIYVQDTGKLSIPLLFSYTVSGYAELSADEFIRLFRQFKFLPSKAAETVAFHVLQIGMHDDRSKVDRLLADAILEEAFSLLPGVTEPQRWRFENAIPRLLTWYESEAMDDMIRRHGVSEVRRWVLRIQEADRKDPAPLTSFDFTLGHYSLGVYFEEPLDEILLGLPGSRAAGMRQLARIQLLKFGVLGRKVHSEFEFENERLRPSYYNVLLRHLDLLERTPWEDNPRSVLLRKAA